MANRADLERCGDKLAQAAAILVYSGGVARRLTAVRALLNPIRSEDMPTQAARDLWIETAQAMLRLNDAATSEDLHALGRQIAHLCNAIRGHIVRSCGGADQNRPWASETILS